MEVMHEIADQVGFLGESGVGGIIFMLLVWPPKTNADPVFHEGHATPLGIILA